MIKRSITLSVVSHGQNVLVNQLLADIGRVCANRVALILTENIPDATPLETGALDCPVEFLRNSRRQGFGANHNAAFQHCRTPYFCVCNPDIRLSQDPFPELLDSLAAPEAAVVGPLVSTPTGLVEDSARRYPTATALGKKLIREPTAPDYPIDRGPIAVDWIGGMFMLFRADAFRAVGGFDESYFMYYEDVDLCARLRLDRRTVIYDPRARVIHDARRESRRKLRLAMHHLASILRFLYRRRVPPAI